MSNNELPKILTSNMQKGGVGKSTIIKNLSTYLAVDKGKKVLNIDGDRIGSLSQFYGVVDPIGTIGELFKPKSDQKEIKIHNVHSNIDLISYDSKLDQKESDLSNEHGKYFILMKWMLENKEWLSKYDYLLIDTHNDFDVFAKNAITISDVVLAPDKPSPTREYSEVDMEYRFEKFKNELVEPISGDSYIRAKLYKVGNMVEHNKNRHIEFLEQLKEEDGYLTWFPNREIFVNATLNTKSMSQLIEEDKGRNHKKYYKRYLEAMNKIENIL
ncbi:ParA family protein [Staphylococcus gallinarum]|uniref:ParA family protein n=1 Tax=Staphylococcus gallinarum TaxID=1293 RepID=UPI001E42570E|nr:ParA family protein [Staphylococcus gallinarum]MCD8845199.1 ParA family protein [Staphylococcus gallinarum]